MLVDADHPHPEFDGAHDRVGNNRRRAGSSLGQRVTSVVLVKLGVGTRIVTHRGPASARRHDISRGYPLATGALSFTKSRFSGGFDAALSPPTTHPDPRKPFADNALQSTVGPAD
jgi:hypothetical protein